MKVKALTAATIISCVGALSAIPAMAQSGNATQGGTGSGNATSTMKKDGGQNTTTGSGARSGGSGMGSSGKSSGMSSGMSSGTSSGGMTTPGAPAGESSTGTTGNTGAAGGKGAGANSGMTGQGSLKPTPGSTPAGK